jgi:hypothetical protein
MPFYTVRSLGFTGNVQQDLRSLDRRLRVRERTILAHGTSQLPGDIDPPYSHVPCIRPATWGASRSITKSSSRPSSLRNQHIEVYTKRFTLSLAVYNRVGETKSLLESTALMAESRSMFNRDFTT